MKDTIIDGRYLILDAVGAGGEARVFRARDNSTGNDVAIRLAMRSVTYSPPGTLPVFPASWVQFYHWGNDTHHGAYQIYELLEGHTLGQMLTHGPFNTESWRIFVDQSLEAVTTLHETGWVHGDLNADNFFLSISSQTGWKLLELPFLRFDPLEGRTSLFGSIHTLAPEQFMGIAPDVRSDLYALGCLYYLAASGQFPHTGSTNQEIAISRLRFPPTPLVEKAPEFPKYWCEWVMTLLESEPERRFPTAAEAARKLLGVA
jgi:serine/threonine protein kinase